MWIDALLTYFHFVSIFLLFAFLSVEAVLLRRPVNADTARLLGRADLFYGIAALLVLVSGPLRMLFGAKGMAFYTGNPLFWIKLLLFAIVGTLSLLPTLCFLRWARAARNDAAFAADEAERRRMRLFVMWEIHLSALIPLLAVLMARGFGMDG